MSYTVNKLAKLSGVSSLAQMYLDHPDFRAFYNRYHPDLAEYLVEAIKVPGYAAD